MGEEATVVLSGIGTVVSKDVLRNMYRTYGPIVRIGHNGANSAQVVFAQKEHALKAIKATNGAVVYGKTLKVSLQPRFKRSTEPCRAFAAGSCRKGDMCKYYHVTDNAAFATKVSAPKPSKSIDVPAEIQAIPDTKVCRHFARGYCSQGEQCKFAHVLGISHQALPAPTGKVAQLCLFFQSGVCGRGEACRYVHDPKVGSTTGASHAPKAVAQSSNNDEKSKAEPEQKDENRTCVECEKPDAAVWKCEKCDNSLYCHDCDSAVHRARVMAKHKRIKLPSLPKLPSCGECESKTASVRCEQCEVLLCESCDTSVHKFKSLRKHVRAKLSRHLEKVKLVTKGPEKVWEVQSTPQTNAVDPVPYVESVPQLELSSDSESSESENEDMEQEASSSRSNGIEQMSTAESSEAESEEDFDDIKMLPSAPAKSVKVQASQSSSAESEDDCDDKPATALAASVPRLELSSESDSSSDESSESAYALASKKVSSTESKANCASIKPVPVRKPALEETSSESESDFDGEATSESVVRETKKSEQKKQLPSKSSRGVKDEAPPKPMAKKKPKAALKSIGTKAASTPSSKSSSTGSIEDKKAPQVRPALAAPRRAVVPVRNKAGGISEGSSHTLVKKIEAFHESGEANDLHLDATLNGFERLLAHDCAERLGLAHESTGSGLERHIIISRHGAKRSATNSGSKDHKAKKSKHRRH